MFHKYAYPFKIYMAGIETSFQNLMIKFCFEKIKRFCIFIFKEIFPASDSNLVKGVMNLFDCYMDDFYDEKHLESLSDLDIRAQMEVCTFITLFKCMFFIHKYYIYCISWVEMTYKSKQFFLDQNK